jgi:hypothetical protein
MGEFLTQFFTTPEKTLWGNSPGDWLMAAAPA